MGAGGWSDTCGQAWLLMKRTCNRPFPRFGGPYCAGAETQYQTRNLGACPGKAILTLNYWTTITCRTTIIIRLESDTATNTDSFNQLSMQIRFEYGGTKCTQ